MALGKTKKMENFNKIVDARSNEISFGFVRKHDIHYFAHAFGSNTVLRDAFAEYVMGHFEAFEKHIDDAGMFRYVITATFSNIFSNEMMPKVMKFMDEMEKHYVYGKRYERAIKKVRDNLVAIKMLREKIMGGRGPAMAA
ncbi:hypothetical protein ECANGB1_348 [Enterospora canceri]|uniref:Uncharacterized protein n=1 Tax=Enterospora canceri TaxID=1081671 RepID=A0A1Y1S4I4_9MICR|nr:hypothetical protein ECANGB1_348 [Enterospora canceri]